jgi:hypothetical protein
MLNILHFGVCGIARLDFLSQWAIQNIIESKTGVADIRSATMIEFMYATILWVFKKWGNIPISITWVFLGLLAGREFALSMPLAEVNKYRTSRHVSKDAMK